MGKYITCMKNDFTLLGYEYFAKGNGEIIGTHNPHKAEPFKTKKEAEEFLKLFAMDDAKVDEAEKHFKKFEKCDYVYRKIPMLNPEVDIPYNFHTPDEIIEWWKRVKVLPDKSVSFENYKTWPNLYSVTNHLWDIVSYYSRDYKELYYSCTIFTKKEGTFESFILDFKKIVDFCTFVDKNGYKVFQIFDKDLSENGTRYFLYKTDDDCKIEESRWTVHEGGIKKCFEIMHRNFWYGD